MFISVFLKIDIWGCYFFVMLNMEKLLFIMIVILYIYGYFNKCVYLYRENFWIKGSFKIWLYLVLWKLIIFFWYFLFLLWIEENFYSLVLVCGFLFWNIFYRLVFLYCVVGFLGCYGREGGVGYLGLFSFSL